MTHDHHLLPLKTGQPPDDRRVVGEFPVAVELHEIGENPFDVIQGSGAVEVPRKLGSLPARQIGMDFGQRLLEALFQIGHFFGDLPIGMIGKRTQLLHPLVDFRDRLFEI